jgi:nucleotide-binding universal stress UspA family protein
MFKNILVPTDLSPKSLKALEIASDMADENGSRITLLHVIERIEDTDEEEFKSFYEKLASKARVKMQKMIGQHKHNATGVEIESEIIFGNRVGEIVDFAYKHGVDLIILGSHKLNKVDAVEGWATISYKVGILAPSPVLLVK